MASKRIIWISFVLGMLVVLTPVLPALAAGTPSAPMITGNACELTVEFDVDASAQYTVEFWDNGVILFSGTQAGAVGDHLVFRHAFSEGIAQGGAPGIAIIVRKWGSIIFVMDPYIGGLTGDCQSSIAARCDPSFSNLAVVGQITDNTNTYFAPGMDAMTDTVLEIGSTWWISGVDESGAFYRAHVGCASVWVPVSALGPNYDDVWNGASLPTNVVN